MNIAYCPERTSNVIFGLPDAKVWTAGCRRRGPVFRISLGLGQKARLESHALQVDSDTSTRCLPMTKKVEPNQIEVGLL